MTAGILGCAEEYTAAIHVQGGRQLWTQLDGITDLSWGRKLDDYSEAEITIAKAQAGADCCQRLGDTLSWVHELTIYRDGAIVWQGPIVQKDETRAEVTLTARDVIMWLDRRVIDVTYEGDTNDDAGTMLREIIGTTFPPGDPFNNPGISEYARIDAPTPEHYAVTKKIWAGSSTVGDLVRDIIDVGIDMFTLGRKLYLVPEGYRVSHAPYRLTEDDFMAELTVRENGLETATEGFVISQQQGATTGQTPLFAKFPAGHHGGAGDPSAPPWYGRITRFSESQSMTDKSQPPDPNAPPNVNGMMGVAQSLRAHGFPTPKSVIIPQGAQLAPTAPVSLGQLVPGRVFQVLLESYCTPAAEKYRLNEVDVTWSSGGVEEVSISLATMRSDPLDEGSPA